MCSPAHRDLLSHSHTSHSCSISGIFHWSPKLHLVGVDTHCKTERELTVSSSTSPQQEESWAPRHLCPNVKHKMVTIWLLWEPQLLISVLMNKLPPQALLGTPGGSPDSDDVGWGMLRNAGSCSWMFSEGSFPHTSTLATSIASWKALWNHVHSLGHRKSRIRGTLSSRIRLAHLLTS